jgi:hypothetical protein
LIPNLEQSRAYEAVRGPLRSDYAAFANGFEERLVDLPWCDAVADAENGGAIMCELVV